MLQTLQSKTDPQNAKTMSVTLYSQEMISDKLVLQNKHVKLKYCKILKVYGELTDSE